MASETEDEIQEFEDNIDEEELETEPISEITSMGSEELRADEEETFFEGLDELSTVIDEVKDEISEYKSIDFTQFTYSDETKPVERIEYDDESISNESDIIDRRMHLAKKRYPTREIEKEKAKQAVKDYKRDLREAIKRDYKVRLAKAKEKRKCYNFLKTCSMRCDIEYIHDWERYLIKEKDIVVLRKRKVPITVKADEIEFLKIRQGDFAKIIFAKRAFEEEFIDEEDIYDKYEEKKTKYEEIYKKYYMIKAYSKLNAIKWNTLEFIKHEKDILTAINFPLISHLEFFYQDQDYLYLGFPFIAGKSLRHYLSKETRLPEALIKFYAAQILLALEYLQFSNILYRNLKPDNIIVEPTGYIKLVGFMKAKIVRDRTYTRCIDLEYAPPELFTDGEYGKPADWWALAVNIFELGTGFTPFESGNNNDTIERITKGVYKKPGHFSLDLRHLLERMLTIPHGCRAGTTTAVPDEVKRHIWFDSINWDALINKEIIAPLIPGIHNPLKEHQFVGYSEAYMTEYFYEEFSDAEQYEDYFYDF